MSIDAKRGRAGPGTAEGGTERGARAGAPCAPDGNSMATGTGRGGADE